MLPKGCLIIIWCRQDLTANFCERKHNLKQIEKWNTIFVEPHEYVVVVSWTRDAPDTWFSQILVWLWLLLWICLKSIRSTVLKFGIFSRIKNLREIEADFWFCKSEHIFSLQKFQKWQIFQLTHIKFNRQESL